MYMYDPVIDDLFNICCVLRGRLRWTFFIPHHLWKIFFYLMVCTMEGCLFLCLNIIPLIIYSFFLVLNNVINCLSFVSCNHKTILKKIMHCHIISWGKETIIWMHENVLYLFNMQCTPESGNLGKIVLTANYSLDSMNRIDLGY